MLNEINKINNNNILRLHDKFQRLLLNSIIYSVGKIMVIVMVNNLIA